MNDTTRYESIQEPLDDEERELMDPENWDWENPVEAVVADNPLVSFRIALTREEHKRLAQAARSKGLRTPGFIKFAALEATRVEASQT
jgi:hypothetical protein